MDPQDEIERRVREDIERFGWHVALVPGEGETPGWAWTLGLFERFAHPELAIFGMPLEEMHRVLNLLGLRVKRGLRLADGARIAGIFEAYALALRQVDVRWVDPFFGNVAWHYRRADVPLLQVLWPDAQGRFPWEPDFDPAWRREQPLLFESAAARALPSPLARQLRAEGVL